MTEPLAQASSTTQQGTGSSIADASQRDKVEMRISIDPDLLEEINHLTQDPSRIIEAALRRWLRGEPQRDEDLARTFSRNVPVPPRGEWND
ncbi:type II toxin-antitoxin system CcdA family antitoxin [Prochlorothrix hollandica]|uniref:Type II toxin-antitoxin system CcdA family antitoxin n=1 Tax=Prochlorothrix hollandica PCC 9006 = CALU 1027 TaxID=317619 RepID=A0A0M2Q2T9_PROHO|nr:type II toxin-antitoxin system CcdA family antitoxin [Prochlorothrix hollandica]KKJ00907.1 hypothetical protein PROH_00170 [Prochlorothrix hollandica PCC 9006 = CALU 1027]